MMRQLSSLDHMAEISRLRSSFANQDCGKDSIVCPKPRRLVVLDRASASDTVRSLRRSTRNQGDVVESKAGSELLEIILSKGSYSGDNNHHPSRQAASSPPYFSASPPSRVGNPIIQDARFTEECHLSPAVFSPSSATVTSPSPSSRKGSCSRASVGHKPAAVRIEGFDCLDRDSRSCGIPAMA